MKRAKHTNTAKDVKEELLRLIEIHDGTHKTYQGLKHGIRHMILDEIPDENLTAIERAVYIGSGHKL